MNYSKKFLAVAVAATTLVSVPAASAQPAPYGKGDALTAVHAAGKLRPVPYERGKVSPAKVGKLAHRARMVPRPGSDNTNRLCSSPSKARRIACR